MFLYVVTTLGLSRRITLKGNFHDVDPLNFRYASFSVRDSSKDNRKYFAFS